MMRVLVDTSVWIDYFRSGGETSELDYLIDNNFVFTNDLVLTELVPFLRLQHQISIVQVINEVANLPLSVDWSEIQEFQYTCLKSGINGVGIPDLIIVQNAKQSESLIFSLDKHFGLMLDVLDFELYL
ncbi:MAG: PIN domain-containing protein [Deltaproteobacteria bacterium]|nr:PIN domain-containing protein [Deltaproteobacteria bacterium]MBT4267056.1 PIN domain-containing protein [Deltaproteobacteria bacterium]MBT4637998.1 PIN domain-containing protein [Deltaproteobacteria bacterium]MBT6501048.1 PIN domain-containing protein [Deltaproteobacteria bacterium]MBT6616043.1 PIN domain-containing protein [Deltaproteobacteria bacterium]